jgi:glycosyltransferase involved in cell wall biosynthesis
MTISIIICTYNREKYIPQLLESIARQDFPAADYEIVFVNNNSPDQTAQRCREFQAAHPELNFAYFEELKQGLSHARNRGIDEAKGDILAFIDDDALAHEDYLKNMHAAFQIQMNVFAAGGKILPLYESKRPKWMSRFLEPVMSVIDLGSKPKAFPTNKFPVGANMMFRKTVFEQVGSFNTDLGRTGKKMLGGEEKDLFYRMRKAEMPVFYLPNVVVSHAVPDERLTENFIRKQALGIGESEKIRTKNFGQGKYGTAIFKEFLKWGASLLLFVWYAAGLQYPKAAMIIKFRYWVSKGMLKN